MKIYLVRHGQTDWNITGRFQGWADIPLDASGIEHAKNVSHFFKDVDIDVLYSSDLIRALQTTSPLSIQKSLPIFVDNRFRELSVGEWEGKNWSELSQAYKEFIERSSKNGFTEAIPGGESLKAFQDRMASGFESMVQRHVGKDIVLVTHGGSIRVLLCYLMNVPLIRRDEFPAENGSVYILEYHPLSKTTTIINKVQTNELSG
ncbi:MAG: histidine phosphatase family protein [Candidatus Izemoplasmatales bacterium]|jgi:broad specificity phosphatase PhoE|nr:histidine phosphatase family protein [bacterium]MDZ4197218.1 histidine phosphatase family protein [Candidatus Izemoplasmatales bacterium]